MIPNNDKQVNIRQSGRMKSQQMGIDASSLEHIVGILTNLYADPALAVIRELSSNAYDSHIQSGQEGRPIDVTLPSQTSPEFIVKDYGVGLSEDEVFNIYGQYGASTKRTDAKATGMLGLGAKAPLSYSNSFSLEAIKNGVKNIFSVHLNREGLPSITKIFETRTDEGNGVTVKVPVTDVREFNLKAENFYSFFPYVEGFNKINRIRELTPGVFLIDSVKSYILMGGVPYEFDSKIPLLVEAPMGAVDFTPSREALHMTHRTQDFIKNTLDTVLNGLANQVDRDWGNLKNVHEAHDYLRDNQKIFEYLGRDTMKYSEDVTLYTGYYTRNRVSVPIHDKTDLYHSGWRHVALGYNYLGGSRDIISYPDVKTTIVVVTDSTPSNYTRGRVRMWLEQNSDYRQAVFVKEPRWLESEYGMRVIDVDTLRSEVRSPRRKKASEKYTIWTRGGYKNTDVAPQKGDVVMSREKIREYAGTNANPKFPYLMTDFTFYAVPTTRQEKFHKDNPGLIHEDDFFDRSYIPFLLKEFPDELDWVQWEPEVYEISRIISNYDLLASDFSDPDLKELIRLCTDSRSPNSHLLGNAQSYLRRVGHKYNKHGVDKLHRLYGIVQERYPLVWGDSQLKNLIVEYSQEQYRKVGK